MFLYISFSIIRFCLQFHRIIFVLSTIFYAAAADLPAHALNDRRNAFCHQAAKQANDSSRDDTGHQKHRQICKYPRCPCDPGCHGKLSNIMKHTAKKVRRMYKDQIVAGFAGATADAFTLFERFAAHLEQTGGNLIRAAVELAKDWRSDKFLRKLEAMLLVADRDHTLVLSGTGDVIEPDDGIASIGSGGPYALSAARALVRHSDLGAEDIALESMKIASELCVFTSGHYTLEVL